MKVINLHQRIDEHRICVSQCI